MLSGDLVGYKIKKKNGEALQFYHTVFYTYTIQFYNSTYMWYLGVMYDLKVYSFSKYYYYSINLFFRNNFSYIYFAHEKVFNNGDNTKKIVFINDGSVLNDIPLVLLISLT